MAEETTEREVRHNPEASRFEIHEEGRLAVAEYRREGQTLIFDHTVVPPELGGRGLGKRLVRAGLAYARAEALQVIPECTFFASFMQKHPETHDLLPAAERSKLGL